jgi:hypothetical protein
VTVRLVKSNSFPHVQVVYAVIHMPSNQSCGLVEYSDNEGFQEALFEIESAPLRKKSQ